MTCFFNIFFISLRKTNKKNGIYQQRFFYLRQLSDIIKGNLKHYEENKDLIGRKQIIHCLGKYCETPCHLQRDEYTPFNEEDGLKPLFALIKWLGTELNNRFKE